VIARQHKSIPLNSQQRPGLVSVLISLRLGYKYFVLKISFSALFRNQVYTSGLFSFPVISGRKINLLSLLYAF
jgi:hypothetical protein